MTSHPDPPAEHANQVAVEGFGDITEDDAYVGEEDDPGTTTRGGGKFLTDLADVLRSVGLTVNEYDGWQQRGRHGEGLREGPLGIVVHHTASGRSSDGQRDADSMTKVHELAPIANLYLDRQGSWWTLAAGRTNTNGKGGPWGPIRENGANHRVIGIEAGNSGVGEAWAPAMQDSYVRGVAALADRYGVDTSNVLSHHEWAPTRKFDPIGPSRFGSINRVGTWDMDKFRAEVNAARGRTGNVQVERRPESNSDTDAYVVRPGDAWWSIAEKTLGDPGRTWELIANANGGQDRVLLVGQVVTIPRRDGASGGAAQRVTAAPEFPGEAVLGMKGPIVLAWQEALIARGIIADNADNRDADYAEGMERAVLELQQSWGWSDADGKAGSGTWKRLHEGS